MRRVRMLKHVTEHPAEGISVHYPNNGVFNLSDALAADFIAGGAAAPVDEDDHAILDPSPAAGTVTVDQNTET